MARAGWKPAIAALGRMFGFGLSWALVWTALSLSVHVARGIQVGWWVTPGMIVAWYGRYGLLLGLPFGAALAVAGRNRRASELSLPRTLTCAFLACALVEGLRMVATLSFGLATSLSWALAACIDAAIVTVLWFLAMRGGARALALLGPRA